MLKIIEEFSRIGGLNARLDTDTFNDIWLQMGRQIHESGVERQKIKYEVIYREAEKALFLHAYAVLEEKDAA